MKKFLKQFGKVICYYVFFGGMQIVMYVAFSFIYGVKAGLEMAAGMSIGSESATIEAIALGAENFLMQNMYIIMILSGCLTLLVLWIFFLIRRKKLLAEINVTALPIKYVPVIFVIGITLTATIFFAMNLLPETLLEAYAQKSELVLSGSGFDEVIAIMIIAPIVEEVIFRGLILSRLRKAVPIVWAVTISSLLFGISHGQIIWIIYTFILGIILSIVVVKTKSLIAGILLHILFNIFGTVIPTVCDGVTSMVVSAIGAVIAVVITVMLLIVIIREKHPAAEKVVLQ